MVVGSTHERTIEREVGKMEVVDKEREERLERIRGKVLEWTTIQTCKNMIMELVGDAVQESRRNM